MAYTLTDDPGAHMNTGLYTGTGSSNAVTGLGFQPDMTWIKIRNTTGDHQVYDSLRGVTVVVYPNQNVVEATVAETLMSFDSDGFTLGTSSTINSSTGWLYVGWCWKGGTTTGIDTTGSTITPSSYTFNQDTGISMIKYTGNNTSGALLPHGLGAVPQFALFKVLDAVDDWSVYHQAMGNTKYMELNTAQAEITSTDRWNDTSPNSVNFTLGNSGGTNAAKDYVAYCFAPKQGFSQFGSYTGNLASGLPPSTTGPFIFCGFRPAWVLCKITAISAWTVFDNTRQPYNTSGQTDIYSIPNTTAEEYANLGIDFLSNGFRFRDSDSEWNASGSNYIYAAFAENPFVNSSGVPVNAR